MLDIYIDESQISINEAPVLIYGVVIPTDFEQSIKELLAIKQSYGLGKDVEVKWTLKHPDRQIKAEAKRELLYSLAGGFSCLLSITKGDDKDAAFINTLRQVTQYARHEGRSFLNIYYDADSFKSINKVRVEIDSWEDLHCVTLARLDSKYSIGIQFADILAGTFRYILSAAFGGSPKILREYDEMFEDYIEFMLDEQFRLILRRSIWGFMPEAGPDEEDFGLEFQMKNCFGTGITVNGDFSEEELRVIRESSQFYMGCLH